MRQVKAISNLRSRFSDLAPRISEDRLTRKRAPAPEITAALDHIEEREQHQVGRKMQAGPRMLVGIQLERAKVGPTSGLTWRSFSLRCFGRAGADSRKRGAGRTRRRRKERRWARARSRRCGLRKGARRRRRRAGQSCGRRVRAPSVVGFERLDQVEGCPPAVVAVGQAPWVRPLLCVVN
jgi:hypothetical protein